MRTVTTLVVLAACAALGGCMGGDDEDARPAPARVDSTERFSGEERQVAQVIEQFEAAVLADDVETICRDLLAVEENHGYDEDNGGHDFCVVDPANQPDLLLAEGGGAEAYDLVVERVRREGAIHGIDRFSARVGSEVGSEEFTVQKRDGEWLITQRDFSIDGASTRLAGEFDCDGRGHAAAASAGTGAEVLARVGFQKRPKSDDPRDAILAGPFGAKAEKAIEDGGSLELSSAFYRPDYHLMYALRDEDGKLIVGFPVTVWGPRNFDTYSMTFCRNGQQSAIII